MIILRLNFLTSYLSDQVIGGFTTGSAVHIFFSQLNKLIGVDEPIRQGLFKLFYVSNEVSVRDKHLFFSDTMRRWQQYTENELGHVYNLNCMHCVSHRWQGLLQSMVS